MRPCTEPGVHTQDGKERAGRVWHRRGLVLVCLAVPTAFALAQSGTSVAVFGRPFLVEHRVIQRDDDGSVFETPPVTDYYAGSRIVSVRGDGGRTIVDFARRDITTVDPQAGTYSVLSFDRVVELRQRLRRAEVEAGAQEGAPSEGQGRPTSPRPDPPSLRVEELPPAPRAPGVSPDAGPWQRAGVRRFRVTAEGQAQNASPATSTAAGPVLEVWLDPRIRLSAEAMAALAALEREVLADRSDGADWSAGLALVRERAGGAFPVRTVRPRSLSGHQTQGSVEDVASRLEEATHVPAELFEVPDGYRRVAHQLELAVAVAEDEARRARAAATARDR